MKTPALSFVIASFGVFSSLGASDAYAQASEPLKVDEMETLSATVESLDLDKRLIELRGEQGEVTLQVPEDVRNLEKVKVGDQVEVTYYTAFAAQLKNKGESTTTDHVDVQRNVVRAAPNTRPRGAISDTVTTTVVIEAVDRPNNAVTFTGPSGMTRTVNVQDPSAKQFIGTLKQGDEVELTYTEALAVSVEPKAKSR